MITFKNLPDTTTPLNAENLNANFNELNSKIITTPIWSADANTLTETRWSPCSLTANKVTSSADTDFGIIKVTKYSDAYCTQEFVDINANNTYTRCLINGNWTRWRQLNIDKITFNNTWKTGIKAEGQKLICSFPVTNSLKAPIYVYFSNVEIFYDGTWHSTYVDSWDILENEIIISFGNTDTLGPNPYLLRITGSIELYRYPTL